MKKTIQAMLMLLTSVVFGCEIDTEKPSSTQCQNCIEDIPDVQCVNAKENDICIDALDMSIVARCVQGKCKPFGCDICPRLPCQNIACVDDRCHQYPIPDGSTCAKFSEPLATTGNVGFCIAGECQGNAQCGTNDDCPSVECVPTACSINGVCVGYATTPGTVCQMSTGGYGRCFNYTCNPTPNYLIPRPISYE